MSLATIRAELAAAVHTNSTFANYNVYKYEPKNPQRPCAIVGWPDVYDPRGDFAGNLDIIIPVRFELIWLGDEASDEALMEAMDNAVAAFRTDRTLNGTVDDLSCAAFTDIGSRVMPDDRVVMQFVVPVEIMA